MSDAITMSQYVIVGGPHDGKRLETDNRGYLFLIHQPPIPSISLIEKHEYLKTRIVCDGLTVAFYRHTSLDDKAAIQMLVDGYRKA